MVDGLRALPDDDLAALERFVLDNDDLLALETRIGRFNVFDALGVSRRELQHSNFLAFLLDPAESHGQSQLFLKAILMDLLRATPPALRPLSPIELDGADLRGVTVRRESNSIDLLVTCESPPLVVVIENKVDSGQHSDQLARYEQVAARNYPDRRPLFVYLTREGVDPESDRWIAYSYRDVHRVLRRARDAFADSIGADVLVFLDHYLDLIGSRFMDDPALDELCRRIYKNHRRAIDLILERRELSTDAGLDLVEESLRGDTRWHVFYRTSKLVDFVPASWTAWLPPRDTDQPEHPQSWLVLRALSSKDGIKVHARVRRMSDARLRTAVIDFFRGRGSELGLGRTNWGSRESTRTQISEPRPLLSGAPGESDQREAWTRQLTANLEALHEAWKQVEPELREVVSVIAGK